MLTTIHANQTPTVQTAYFVLGAMITVSSFAMTFSVAKRITTARRGIFAIMRLAYRIPKSLFIIVESKVVHRENGAWILREIEVRVLKTNPMCVRMHVTADQLMHVSTFPKWKGNAA
jgi:hypothetical protein